MQVLSLSHILLISKMHLLFFFSLLCVNLFLFFPPIYICICINIQNSTNHKSAGRMIHTFEQLRCCHYFFFDLLNVIFTHTPFDSWSVCHRHKMFARRHFFPSPSPSIAIRQWKLHWKWKWKKLYYTFSMSWDENVLSLKNVSYCKIIITLYNNM